MDHRAALGDSVPPRNGDSALNRVLGGKGGEALGSQVLVKYNASFAFPTLTAGLANPRDCPCRSCSHVHELIRTPCELPAAQRTELEPLVQVYGAPWSSPHWAPRPTLPQSSDHPTG